MSFGSHEMVVRITIEGDFNHPGVHAWIMAEAEQLGVHGWSRDRSSDDTLEALFAGEVALVLNMLRQFSDGTLPDGIETISERDVTGDEPVWLGFHVLPGI
ncbi:MAG: acylphosphatase [Alphaproteobacteria bacterium]